MKKIKKFVYDFYINRPFEYIQYRTSKGVHYEDNLKDIFTEFFLKLDPDKLLILDIGCGFNKSLGNLTYNKYTGIDISPTLIKHHRFFGAKNSNFIIDDVENIDYRYLTYNFVVGSLILNYIQNPKDLLSQIDIGKCLFYFVCPNPDFDRKYGTVLNEKHVTLRIKSVTFEYFLHDYDKIFSEFGTEISKVFSVIPDKLSVAPYIIYYNSGGQNKNYYLKQ